MDIFHVSLFFRSSSLTLLWGFLVGHSCHVGHCHSFLHKKLRRFPKRRKNTPTATNKPQLPRISLLCTLHQPPRSQPPVDSSHYPSQSIHELCGPTRTCCPAFVKIHSKQGFPGLHCTAESGQTARPTQMARTVCRGECICHLPRNAMANLVAHDPGYGARIWPSLKGSCPTLSS